ncbi:MAG: transposase [Candidatus Omnitrophica bacterium]|nr:transposase [Candidatus Omnitrophota bacterium]MCM8823658.1 transposase [Candidatus Omnitrophota bacterium]
MSYKDELVTGAIYHVCSKSIAHYQIFNNKDEYLRMYQLIRYYQMYPLPEKFSRFIETDAVNNFGFSPVFNCISKGKEKLVQIIAYCFMPTHIHLILKQLKDKGVLDYMRKILDGYTRYFNTKHKRKSPLWESRFQRVLVENDEYLLHLTRYIHLNLVTAYLIGSPQDWLFSSYNEYIEVSEEKICEYSDILDIQTNSYKIFVNDQISYQRELAKLKHLLLED